MEEREENRTTSFAARLLVGALSLGVAVWVVPGITVNNVWTLVLAAFLLGIVNAIVRPVLVVLTLPITILTLGIFLLVINAGMLALVAAVLPGFRIAGFGPALLGWIVLSLTGWAASRLLGR